MIGRESSGLDSYFGLQSDATPVESIRTRVMERKPKALCGMALLMEAFVSQSLTGSSTRNPTTVH